MGVQEQAAHAASLVVEELREQIDRLHEELHAVASERTAVAALKELSERVEALEKAVRTPRTVSRTRTSGE
jgi:chorismate mutase